MKDIYKKAYMDMAIRFGETSMARRLKVGALIVNDEGIISEGCNGMPPHWPTEVCEDKVYAKDEQPWFFDGELDVTANNLYSLYPSQYPLIDKRGIYKLVTKPECRHAEIAALEKLWNKPNIAKGASIFISHSPCVNCCIKLFIAGIEKVYYRTLYRDTKGLDYLKENGVEVGQI